MQALAILLGAALTIAACWALGVLLLQNSCPDPGVRFVAGASVLSTIGFVLCSAGAAYGWLLAGIPATAAVAGLWQARRLKPIGAPGLTPRWIWIPFTAFMVLYLCHAMAPEASPDGSTYHLGLVARYLREHGFVRVTDNFYSAMPGGVEMLYLFAFPIGGPSATALVHLAFLAALAWQMYTYASRSGFAQVGAAAALLVFASPLIGIDATSAYNDVALAAIAFTLFNLLDLWRSQRDSCLLIAIGLVAGFGLATKYTAWLGIVYAICYVAWHNRRAAVICTGCAALVPAPWLIKNCIYFQNPVAPFFNRLFLNPYVTIDFENTYRHTFVTGGLTSRWQIPVEAMVRGGLTGVLGPVFLLAPLGLLALRRREGRQLWLATLVFGANYFSNIGARFLLPVLPFVSLAMMLALAQVPRLALGIAVLHAVISWPSMVPKYARSDAWRLEKFPWREALRIKPESGYLESHLVGYGIDRMIEDRTRPGSTVFTFTPIPEVYTSRHIRVEYQAASNKIAGALLWTPVEPTYVPTWRVRFGFPRQTVRAIRLVQVGTGPGLWTVHELRLFDASRELPRLGAWRLTAHPYPWGIQDAFDNSLATFWMCGEPLGPGQSVEIAFGKQEALDGVVIESSPNQDGLRLRLEGRDEAGNWHVFSSAPTISDAPRPLGLRRAVAEELKRRGIDYVLLFNGQVAADDFRENADLWGAIPVGKYKDARLYELR